MARKNKRFASALDVPALSKSRTLRVPSIEPLQSSPLLALPVELQVEILSHLLVRVEDVKLEKEFPPKRHNKRWLKELSSLGVAVSYDAPKKRNGLHPHGLSLNVLLACRELHQVGNQLFWSRNKFCFQDWRHLRHAWSNAHQRPNLSQIRHITVRALLDHPGRLQISGNLREALQYAPLHQAITAGDLFDGPAMFKVPIVAREALDYIPAQDTLSPVDFLDPLEYYKVHDALQKSLAPLPRYEPIKFGDLVDHPEILQVPGCLYDILQHFTQLRSVDVRVGLFSENIINAVLYAAFHRMDKLLHLKSYVLEWRYTCWCGGHDCRKYRACMDIVAMDPGRRKAVLEEAWGDNPPYETWDVREWDRMRHQMVDGDDRMD